MGFVNTAAARHKSDLRALILTLTIIGLFGAMYRWTHVQMFAVAAVVAVGLYLIRFGRLAYLDPDTTIDAWQSFYSYLRPGSRRSRIFLRGVAVVGVFGGVLFITTSLLGLLNLSPHERTYHAWLAIGGSALIAFLLLPRRYR